MCERCFRLVVSLLLVGSYFILPKYGFTFHGPWVNHFLYPFSHVNIWHLAVNILCLWMLRCPLHLIASYVIAVLCSFLPSFSLFDYFVDGRCAICEPTYGFSGVLFAIVGVSWGRVNRFRDMIWKNKWFLFIPAFLPHVNFLIHIYCLLAGFLYGYLCDKKSENS